MNQKLQKVLIGAGGFFIGAGVANVLTTLYTKKKAEKIVDEFIESVKSELDEMNESLELAQQVNDSYLEILKENKLGPFSTPQGASVFLREEDIQNQKIDYTQFDQNTRMTPAQAHDFVRDRMNDVIVTRESEPADAEVSTDRNSESIFDREDVAVFEKGEGYSDSSEEKKSEEEPESPQEEGAVDPFFLNRDHSRPFLISLVEYHETEDDFDKEQLTYYDGDDVLTDVHNKPINEKGRFNDALVAFGDKEHFGDSNQVFLRDPVSSVDYEITREEGIKYLVAVLGEEDPDSPRGRVNARRREARQNYNDE